MQRVTEFSKLPLAFPFGLAEDEAAEHDTPRVYKWTKDEYYRLAEVGFLEGKRTELIDGEIIETPTMKSPHATALSLTDEALRRIEDNSYGWCEETGEPISLARLDARPTATLSLEAQERHERMERVHRDD